MASLAESTLKTLCKSSQTHRPGVSRSRS